MSSPSGTRPARPGRRALGCRWGAMLGAGARGVNRVRRARVERAPQATEGTRAVTYRRATQRGPRVGVTHHIGGPRSCTGNWFGMITAIDPFACTEGPTGQEWSAALRIGVPRETTARETRVAATPATVAQLVQLGYEVVVETGAGEGSSFPDEAFAEAGGARLGRARGRGARGGLPGNPPTPPPPH